MNNVNGIKIEFSIFLLDLTLIKVNWEIAGF